MNYISKRLRNLIIGLSIAAAPVMQAQDKSSVRMDMDSPKQATTVSYWQGNSPYALFRYTSPEKYDIGSRYKTIDEDLKIVGSNNINKKDFGLYEDGEFDKQKRHIGFGVEASRAKGKTNATFGAHATNPVNNSHKIFTGYAYESGNTAVVGDFFKHKKLYTAVVGAARISRKNNELSRHKEGIFVGIENYHKSFLNIDGENVSYTGFTKFGKSRFERAFTQAGFESDMEFTANRTYFTTNNYNFYFPLPQVSTSELGSVGIAVRYKKSSGSDSASAEIFKTYDVKGHPLITGLNAGRNPAAKTKYSANGNIGTVIGPFRVIGNIGTDMGIYVSSVIRVKK